MTILVTGASGFLGRAVCTYLSTRKIDYVGYSRSGGPGLVRVDDYRSLPADGVIIHLAQDPDRRRVEDLGAAYIEEMADSARVLAEKSRRLVFASSGVVYGEAAPQAHPESDELSGGTPYAQLKIDSEQAVQDSTNSVVARLSNVYGPGMSESTVLSDILEQIEGTGPIEILDSGPIHDFVWVECAASALAKMAMGSATGTYNVGTGIGVTIGELAEKALNAAGQTGREIKSGLSADTRSCLVLDPRLAQTTWSWVPKVDIKHGLRELLARR